MKRRDRSEVEDRTSLNENDRQQLVEVFVAEADEHLLAMEETLLALETAADDGDLVDTLLRLAHSLKGNASCVGFDEVSDLAHALEELFSSIRKRVVEPEPALFSVALTAVDALRSMVHRTLVPDVVALTERLRRSAAGNTTADAEVATKGPRTRGESASRRAAVHATLRVDVRRLDELLDMTGEIAVARARTHALLRSLPRELADALEESERQNDRLFGDLQELVMKVRMVPIGPVLRSFARVVRDLAEANGKSARVEISGGELEVDMSIVDLLRDPLTHIVRNAVDHGIEMPRERTAAGKPETGVVAIRAAQESGWLRVEVSDDGAGLKRSRIAAKASSMGVDVSGMSEWQVERLVFEPGFTTAGEVTQLSGRGFGMDVVRRNVEALRGNVSLRSREGEGLSVTIRVPLTLAIISGFQVDAGSTRCIIPMDAVVECLAAVDVTDTPTGLFLSRGEVLPYVRLSDVVGAAPSGATQKHFVVVRHPEGVGGLLVDGLHGESQTVVKPLGSYFGRIPTIRGCGLLGDGGIALVVDGDEIFRRSRENRLRTPINGNNSASTEERINRC